MTVYYLSCGVCVRSKVCVYIRLYSVSAKNGSKNLTSPIAVVGYENQKTKNKQN